MTEAQTTFADQAGTTPTNDMTVDENGGITIGDRTFTNQEDLVKSWQNGQTHIATLEAERETDREALLKARTVDEVLEKIQSKQDVQAQQTASTEQVVTDNLTKDDVNELLAQRDFEAKANQNTQRAMDLAKDSLGTDYIVKLGNKAKELGMSEPDALLLASKSPEAFSKLFIPQGSPASSSSFGDINATAIQPHQERAESARVEIGASSSDMVRAWNAAAPKT